jgi:hypothetical protein
VVIKSCCQSEVDPMISLLIRRATDAGAGVAVLHVHQLVDLLANLQEA